MKKFGIFFCLLLILIATAAIAAQEKPAQTSAYFRMHVRANSDDLADQQVKYEVKDAIVRYLVPVAAECEDKQAAIAAFSARLDEIEAVADEVLAARGFSYRARARVCEEEFPDRVYEGLTLAAGVYDALIVELGSGEGANWWCVIYPPLCFSGEVSGSTVVYRSRLLEIIENFFAK